MGRQIHFFQLESDIQDMLFFLKQHHLSIFNSNSVILTHVEESYEKYLVAINDKYIPCKIGVAN